MSVLSRAVVLTLLLLLPGCAYYSFTGASIPEHLNTIAIPLVEDRSISPITSMSDEMTRLLTERFVNQTRLRLQPDETAADVVLSASIDGYRTDPTSVTADDQAALNRVTLTVTARYFDRVRNEEIYSRSFSAGQEYDPAGGVDAEIRAATVAMGRVADDIFTAATSNW